MSNWKGIKEDAKYLLIDVLSLLVDTVYELMDAITPEYIGYRLLLHKVKKHMWTKQYLRNFEDAMGMLVCKNKIKPKHKDKIIVIARKNSDLGYEKYKWCFECGRYKTKECNSKICYKDINGDKPLLFKSKFIK